MMSMPLTMVPTGEPNVIKKIGGKEETRRFLENLGFVTGSYCHHLNRSIQKQVGQK